MKKRIVSIILTLAMVVLLLPQNSLPVFAAGTITVADFTELKNAILTAAEGATIEITAPISVTADLEVTKSLTFTASGTGKITRDSSFTSGNIIQINASGKTVTFHDITIDGNSVSANGRGIIVKAGALVFDNSVVLQNCNTSVTGAGVYVNNDATFTMNGGSITSNTAMVSGGGVYNAGIFTMNDGSITNNRSSTDGGGGISNDNIFNMTGGIIENNHAAKYGGGVFISNVMIFTMTGGSIINNTVDNNGLGGGIETGRRSSVRLSGNVQIYGNKKLDGSADNIYMEDRNTLELTGALTNTTPIGVKMENVGVFTSGIAVENNTYIDRFTSDDSVYTVQPEGNQLKLAKDHLVTITVNKDDVAWNDHDKSFKLVKSGTDYTNLTSIPNGTYDVYEGTTDTSADVTVNDAAASATVDYYTVTLTNGVGIASTNGGGTYLKGSSPVISAVFSSNYNWSKWNQTIGGEELSAMNSYTLTSIQSAQSYTAMAVKNTPTIGNIPVQPPVLTGSYLNDVLTKPVISAGTYTITSQGWVSSADGISNWNSIPVGSTCSAALNGYYLRYFVTYSDSGTKIIYSPNIVQLTVNRYTPSMTLSVEPASPQFSGTTITLKASISGGSPDMTNQNYLNTVPVIFKDGTTTLGTVSISAITGIATFETTTLAVGDHNFTAEFPGDSDYNASATSSVVSYTITAAPNPDIAVVNSAKSAAQSASYANMTQTAATSETVIADELKETAEAAVNNGTVTVTNNKISYTAPIAVTSANPSGTDGSYVFTITVSKGSQSQTTTQKTITIIATAYVTPAPSGSSQTTQTKTETKTIKVVEVPQNIPDAELLTVEPVGEAFDDSVEVRLKEDKTTEAMVRRAMEAVSTALNVENAQIFPFDISIYRKGTDTKVQPKEGTSVKITCPIPKELLVNKDKLVVVCVINEELRVLPITLVTKGGVICAQFTATHFSPYAFAIDNDNKLADYSAGTLSDEVTNISTKLTAAAGTLTKVDLNGIKEGSAITYHVCNPTLISIDSNGNLFTKKAGNAILMAKVTYGGVTTVYTIHITGKKAQGGTKVGFIQYYDDIVTYNKINYRITAKATDTAEGTVAVANNQINKKLPEKVVIPATITYKGKTYKVTSIDESAFYNLNKITSVTIPAGLEEISATAFVSCDSLKTFTVSSDNKYYSAKKGMLLNKEGTTLIAYPSAKGTIVIDKKVAVIGAYAFSACRFLTGVVVPKTVTRMEGCAFAHSKSLTKVTLQSTTVPEIPFPCIFETVKEAFAIFVPETSLIKYQTAFKNARMPKGARVRTMKKS